MPSVRVFTRTQYLPISLEAAWDFFSAPGNLPAITPPALGFRVLSDPPSVIYPGLMLRYSVRPLPGFRTAWVSEITHVRAPEYFVDEQRSGPYSIWHHEHRFHRSPGGVRVEDIIHYALPFGRLGHALAGALVRRKLEAIFDYRAGILSERFGTA